ncbi:protein kinase, partial [uncultured Nostoc sp.]|uniref:protein kinase domain-containing protein n=1 Tax=uncultured Nostoc sp. TaxID=340711 RepID=UPI0035CC6FB9
MLNVGSLVNRRYKIINPLETRNSYDEQFYCSYLAEDLHTYKKCVIKPLNCYNYSKNNLFKDAFIQQTKILKKIGMSNERISTFYDYFEHYGVFYIVREWIEGYSLENVLQSNIIISHNFVYDLIYNLLQIIIFLEERNIKHFAIQPSNIILSLDRKVILLDFDIEYITILNIEKYSVVTSGARKIRGFIEKRSFRNKLNFNFDVYALSVTAIILLISQKIFYSDRRIVTGNIYNLHIINNYIEIIRKDSNINQYF